MTDQSALIRRQVLFWSVAAFVAVLLLWLFSGILLPFVLGMVIAYFLDPVADWLERHGVSRLWATVLILGLFVLIFAGVLVILVPVIANQIGGLATRVPEYVDRIQVIIESIRSSSIGWLLPEGEANLKQDLGTLFSEGSGIISSFVASLWSSSLAVVNFVSLFVVTPVVAFYMLLDWDRMVDKIDDWIPRQHVDTVRRLAAAVSDRMLALHRGSKTAGEIPLRDYWSAEAPPETGDSNSVPVPISSTAVFSALPASRLRLSGTGCEASINSTPSGNPSPWPSLVTTRVGTSP